MADALERLVNLALYFADAKGPVTAEQIRTEVAGYPRAQDEAAFLRMFERDKEDLRAAGLAITHDQEAPGGLYALDPSATFAAEVRFTRAELAALHAIGVALAGDPAFPFADDLRLALAKVVPDLDADGTAPAAARLADEDPEAQGASVALLAAAVEARKTVWFGYTNALGESRSREVEPYGLFLRDGRWYLVGHDTATDAAGGPRVYAAARMRAPEANAKQPKSPDFERPEGFDVRSFVGLPFQYGGGEPFEAHLTFSPSDAWRAPALTGGAGTLDAAADGSLAWSIPARDPRRLAQWVVENGPGIAIAGPPEAVAMLRDGLAEAVSAHAG
ncbi:MAG: WYL domain-containing protein [Actinobacteria bacterium]|nr:MAG: WYL domain-containing protein [Actinomycetota bacterium]